MVRVRVIAVLATTATVLLGLSGCGAHSPTLGSMDGGPSTSTPSTPNAAPSTARAPHRSPRSQSSGSTQTSARAAAPTPGVPPAASYDDTSGTTAAPPNSQSRVLAHLPGSATAGCVQVGNQRAVRSGALAMGDFASARSTFTRTKGAYDAPPSNFYVIPQSRTASRVTVTLTRLAGHEAPIRVTSDQVESAAQWHYFPISVKIPQPGRWRFTVVSGDQQGCFETSFAS